MVFGARKGESELNTQTTTLVSHRAPNGKGPLQGLWCDILHFLHCYKGHSQGIRHLPGRAHHGSRSKVARMWKGFFQFGPEVAWWNKAWEE